LRNGSSPFPDPARFAVAAEKARRTAPMALCHKLHLTHRHDAPPAIDRRHQRPPAEHSHRDISMNDRAQIRRFKSVPIVVRVVGAGKAGADFETTGWRQL
jgi:hypothetical protein